MQYFYVGGIAAGILSCHAFKVELEARLGWREVFDCEEWRQLLSRNRLIIFRNADPPT